MHQYSAVTVKDESMGVTGGGVTVERLGWTDEAGLVAPPFAGFGVEDEVKMGGEPAVCEVARLRRLPQRRHAPLVVIHHYQLQSRGA